MDAIGDIQGLDDSIKTALVKKLLPKFESPHQVWDDFLQTTTPTEAIEEMATEDRQSSNPAVESLKESLKLNKPGCILMDLMVDVFSGTHDSDFKSIATAEITILADALNLQSSDKDAKHGGKFGHTAREVYRGLVMTAGKAISANTDEAPAIGGRALQRLLSDPENVAEQESVQAERNGIWRQAQGCRKKFVTLSTLKAKTLDAMTSALRVCGPVYKFNGNLNESHRLFVASADLIADGAAEAAPWSTLSPPSADYYKAMMAFLKAQNGQKDFIAAFDGRMKECRKWQEEHLNGRDYLAEVWLLYQGRMTRTGRARRTVLGSDSREVAHIGLPCARTKLKVQPRESMNACGESSTFNSTYSGIPLRQAAELPLIQVNSKKDILGVEITEAPDDWTEMHGAKVQPLFWQEGKPIQFWVALLTDLNVKAVFDLTPGSGALAEAAMSLGASYHGVCLAPSLCAQR